MFKGVCTALITPFNQDGSINYEQLEELLEFQISQNIDAILICGTTGEPATMTDEEKIQLIDFSIRKINKRVKVLVGAGSNSTAIAVKNAKLYEAMGADALLVVTPYYNKCSQDGLFLHYKAINDAVHTPIILYNVPGRTGVNIQPKTVLKLSDLNNIIGIKEACGNMNQINELASLIKDTNFILYSGDDSLTLPMLSIGAQGLISVASNLIPNELHNMVMAYLNGDLKTAQNIHFKYLKLMNDLFIDVNPIPVKRATKFVLRLNDTLRLPLSDLSEEKTQILLSTLKAVNLIK